MSSRCWNPVYVCCWRVAMPRDDAVFQIRLLGMTRFRPQTEQCATCGQVRRGRFLAIFAIGRRNGLRTVCGSATVQVHDPVPWQCRVSSSGIADPACTIKAGCMRPGRCRPRVESVIELCHRGGGASIAACGFLTGGGFRLNIIRWRMPGLVSSNGEGAWIAMVMWCLSPRTWSGLRRVY